MTIKLQQIVDTLAAGVSATKNSPIAAVQISYNRLIEDVCEFCNGQADGGEIPFHPRLKLRG